MKTTLDTKCRLCRAEGVKLYLKGARCFSPKCPIEKKGAIHPGMHGLKRTKKMSDYGFQLRAKQKLKRAYGGISEAQFSNYYQKAKKLKGLVGDNLLLLLEKRFDNVVYQSGLSLSRPHSKFLISHGHFTVNGKSVNISSLSLKVGDQISLSKKIIDKLGDTLRVSSTDFKAPEWLDVDRKSFTSKVVSMPDIDLIKEGIDINLIIEYYSR